MFPARRRPTAPRIESVSTSLVIGYMVARSKAPVTNKVHSHAGGTVVNGAAGSLPPDRCTASMTRPRSGERGTDERGRT